MILEQFQAWSRTASPSSRADGVRVLAKAILHTDLGAAREEAVTVLTGFLDDPSPLVRTALAEAVGGAAQAPHHLVRALADDQPAIAAIVLGRSPVLTEAELVDCAATARAAVQVAIASRPDLTAGVAAALAEVGAPPALAALAANAAATLSPGTIRRMVERGEGDGALQQALLRRGGLPADVQLSLVAAASRSLADLVVGRGWMSAERMERVAVEARDRAAVTIGGEASDDQRVALASHLRASGQLTVGLAFRALLSGGLDLFRAVLCELTGVGGQRVDALLRSCGSAAFAGLYRDAGLPEELLPAFRAAVRVAAGVEAGAQGGLSLTAVRKVIAACEQLDDGSFGTLLVVLRRFEAEAARDEARSWRETVSARQAPKGEALMLPEGEGAEAHRPAGSGERSGARRPRYTIDLDAIEAQLRAA